MLLKRWLTAIVLIPVLILILLKGSTLTFTFLVLVISTLSMAEYFRITSDCSGGYLVAKSQKNAQLFNPKKQQTMRFFRYKVEVAAYILSTAVIFAAHKNSVEMILLLVPFNIMAMAAIAVTSFKQNDVTDNDILNPNIEKNIFSNASALGCILNQIQGVIYIPIFLSFLVLLRNSENGGHFVLWLWIIIGLSDTGAYYVGSNFGRHSLAKHVSPKKTIEGALGGLAAAVIAALLYEAVFINKISFFNIILFALTTAAAGQLGDLFESVLKRTSKVKDSGTILPGHGGVLDRIDGLIFAAPVAYLFKIFIL